MLDTIINGMQKGNDIEDYAARTIGEKGSRAAKGSFDSTIQGHVGNTSLWQLLEEVITGKATVTTDDYATFLRNYSKNATGQDLRHDAIVALRTAPEVIDIVRKNPDQAKEVLEKSIVAAQTNPRAVQKLGTKIFTVAQEDIGNILSGMRGISNLELVKHGI